MISLGGQAPHVLRAHVWVFPLVSLGGQAPHVLRAHMGPTCGEPNEIELTCSSPSKQILDYRATLLILLQTATHGSCYRSCSGPTACSSPRSHIYACLQCMLVQVNSLFLAKISHFARYA